ncbi:MAG: twin-arginine translocase TatA/TatE family subunit [Rectinema sp.]|nr:twin-arginine translocase TatA/TatE family subunit [Rectinema sp.]
MFGRIGPMELILILLIVLVIFGPRKLPELGKALGETFRLFRKHADDTAEGSAKTSGLDSESPPPRIEPAASQQQTNATGASKKTVSDKS